MLSTFLCADEWLSSSECIVSYADIIYLAQAIEKLCSSVNNITILFDQNWRQLWERRFTDPLSDAEIFKYAGNHLLDIGGKAQDFSQIQGQYMGLLKFTPEGWRQVKNFIQQFSEAMVDKMDMTSLLKQMIKNNYIISVMPNNMPWCEVDNMHDYLICQEIFQ